MDINLENIFQFVVGFTVLQRIAELFWAKRNEKLLKAKGAKVIPEVNYFFMVVLHASWLFYLSYVAFYKGYVIQVPQFIIGITLFFLGQVFRLSAIFTLGSRWSTRIMILPQVDAIKKGIFRITRHPNYLGVILEIFALPYAVGLLPAALLFSLLNFLILFFRIRLEEKYLIENNNYRDVYGIQ